jgi:hypothetical protein
MSVLSQVAQAVCSDTCSSTPLRMLCLIATAYCRLNLRVNRGLFGSFGRGSATDGDIVGSAERGKAQEQC